MTFFDKDIEPISRPESDSDVRHTWKIVELAAYRKRPVTPQKLSPLDVSYLTRDPVSLVPSDDVQRQMGVKFSIDEDPAVFEEQWDAWQEKLTDAHKALRCENKGSFFEP